MSCAITRVKSIPIWNKHTFRVSLALILYSALFPPAVAYSSPDSTFRDKTMETTLQVLETEQKNYYARLPEDLEKYRLAKSELDADIAPAKKDEFIDEEGPPAFYLSAGLDANHIHYKEYSGDTTLDEDYGKLKGFYVNPGYRGGHNLDWLLESKPFIEGYFRRHDALILYDGGSSAGPLAFKERAEIQRYGLKLGGYHNFSSKKEGLFYADFGRRVWYRGENEVIEGVLTYAEKYTWIYLGLGLGGNYKLFPKLTCGAEVEWMGALDAEMRADLYEGGTFKLKDVWGAEIKLPIKYHLSKKISLDLTPYFTWWSIGRSDNVKINNAYYYEPDSHTHIEGLLVGFTYYL